MGKIQTVLGLVDSDSVGIIDPHEHIARKEGKEVDMSSTFLLKDIRKSVQEVNMFKKYKGDLIVDAQPIGGRYIESLIETSKETGVHIVASTGFHQEIFYFNNFWGRYYDIDEIVPLLISEVKEGIEINNYEGPIIKRSSAKAGVCKCASSYQVIREVEEKWIRAASITSNETGVPIITHTDHGTMGSEMIEIFMDEGVNMNNVIMGHLDRNPDIEYIADVASSGCYIQFDGPSRVKYYPDNIIIDLIKKMIVRGYEDKILLAGDMGKRSYHKAYGNGPGFEYILKTFVPRLIKEGIDQKIINKMLIDNPRKALSFKKEGRDIDAIS